MTVVSYLKQKNQGGILTINGLAIEHDRFFDIPFHRTRLTESNGGFIASNDIATLQDGGKRFKLYHEGEML